MRQRFITVERLEAVARAAMLGGYGRLATWRADGLNRRKVHLAISMDCQAPYHYELHARYSATHGKRVKPLIVSVDARCRTCPNCRARRTMFWQARAVTEWTRSPLTLFGTLTFRPDIDLRVDNTARAELFKTGVDFDRDLSAEARFRVRTKYAGKHVTDWLKRIRQSAAGRPPVNIRYLMVAEAHNGARTSVEKRMRPHFHCLLHAVGEVGGLVLPGEWARKSDGELLTDKYGNAVLDNDAFLKSQWNVGFSTFALCRSTQAASYLCKYLSKEEASARVRASFRYGHESESDPVAAMPATTGKSTPLKGDSATEHIDGSD